MDKKTNRKLRAPSQMQMIALCYLLIILLGTALLCLPFAARDGSTSFIDALFTSTSAVCVTGLISVPTFAHWTLFGQIVIILLIQLGGIGFMSVVTFISVCFGRSISLGERKLFIMSAGTDNLGSVFALIRHIIFGTLCFEAVGAVALFIRFLFDMPPLRAAYYAVFHSISAFCNAGFDLMGYNGGSSLCNYAGDVTVNVTVMLLIVIGGLGFVVWNDIAVNKFHFKAYSLHTKIVLISTAILLFGGAILIFLFELGNDQIPLNTGERILTAFFGSVTTRTAGFNTVDLAAMSEGSSALMILLMIIGGAPGSTAGGIKVTTFAALLAVTLSSARKISTTNIFKRRLDDDTLRQASAVATIYFSVVSVAIVAICALENMPIKAVIFEVVSALSNVGMTLGITQSLGAVSKIIIMLLMYCGRVGILTLAAVLADKRENLPISRPPESIIIG